jgi:light-regulated signal transduction histidine kinase (bacteriophytochrome)
MSELLTDLRAYIDATGMHSSPPETADAELILQEVIVNLATAIEETGAVIAHDPLPTLPVTRSHLVQLFQNLISNALKYRSREAPTIRLGAAKTRDQWQFTCADNGVGIPPEHADRIFDFLRRLHGSEVPGSGMGLAICRRIVQRYGGRIWVESNPGGGSIFFFTLPAE